MFRRFPLPAIAAALISLVGPALAPAQAAPGSLSSARERAAALEAQIEANGTRMAMAAERYNAAQLRRAELLSELGTTRTRVQAAEQRYDGLRRQLARRVKTMYMHPGAPLAAWLSMRSLDETGRQRVFSESVLTADAELVAKTDRARREVMTRMSELAALSVDADRTARSIAGQQSQLTRQLSRQRALLSGVTGEIAQILAAERQRELAAARRIAARTQAAPAPRAAQASVSASAPQPAPASSAPSPSSEGNIPAPPPPKAGASTAVSVAAAQIGKPYQWGAEGPDRFDCSGLTMYAWGKAGVQLPRVAADQYAALPKVPKDQLRPGDLVFYGNPIHHMGIYEGGGIMINAPRTGENVRRDSIYRKDYAGASRP